MTDTQFPTEYRGFTIYYSDVNDALNAKPDTDTKTAHPDFVPVAARSWEELQPVLDLQYEREAEKN